MKHSWLFGVLLLLTACTSEKFKTAPDDANVYIVDSAVVNGSYVIFDLRDVEDAFITPVVNCLDGIDYPKGTIVVIDDDCMVSKIDTMSTETLSFVTILSVAALVAIYLVRKKK